MNKTLSIALAGFSFIIDEHAYIKLSDYLSALRGSLDASEADEVMNDIEIRMVEIFKESLGKREVINDVDVEKVIAQIGTPEQIDEQEEAYYSESKQNTKKTKSGFAHSINGERQLFRDPGQQKIAGVCAGLAAYFGMDVTWMRLIWIGVFILLWVAPGSSFLVILLYVILWMVLPKAESASDYLKLKGKPLNFDNLKEESSKIVQFANESTQRVGEIYDNNKQNINQAGSSIWNVLKYIIGIFAFLCAAGAFIGMFAIFAAYNSGKMNVGDNLSFFLEENNIGYLVFAVAAIPVLVCAIGFLFLAIKIFSPKSKFTYVGRFLALLGLLWLAVIGIFAYCAISVESKFEGNNDEKENISINTKSDSIIIDSKNVEIPTAFKSYWGRIYSDKKTIYKHDYPYVKITRKADVAQPYLIINKDADGYNIPLRMTVPVSVVGNKILLPNHFSYPYEYRFRGYNVEYELVVPSKMVVVKNDKSRISYGGDDDNTDSSGNTDDSQDFDYDKYSKGETGITIEKNKIKINGNSIEYNSNDDKYIKINGKTYPIDSADDVLDRLKIDKADLKNLDIHIKDGKDEVRIKAGK
ncbi:PspC domain-containing protein [Soonwooa sp.]|uniref:PspC domain-containing protein n=1 Tax=Soonwooa sp. TaxID=1938592 RepID=UPI002634434D|nr:PspC domain-containing protein [Soonwooa sp.]